MQDIIGYLEKMEKSMVYKLFFIDIIDITKYDLIVGFGYCWWNIYKILKWHFYKFKVCRLWHKSRCDYKGKTKWL